MTVSLLQRLTLPIWHARLRDPALIDGVDEFREHVGGELCITLLRGIGCPIEVHELSEDALRCAIERVDRAHKMPPLLEGAAGMS